MKSALLLLLLLANSMYALENAKPKPKFWTVPNTLTVIGTAGATAADAWATERNLSRQDHHEANPLMPSTTGGRVAYFAGTEAATVLGAYLLHRSGHPTMAKWALRIHLTVETGWAIRSTQGYHH